MKNLFNFLLLFVLAVATPPTLNAQNGTSDDGFIMNVTGGGQYALGDCGYNTATWGGDISTETCVNVVWAYDITPDSMCCDTILNNYAGKFVMIRRGTCEFGAKALKAEQAGAIGVIVVNHFATATENGCTSVPMGPGVVGDQVTIPAIFVGRDIGIELDGIIKTNGEAEICFVFPRMLSPTSASMYATPLSQVSTMQGITVLYNNRSGVQQTDVNLKAEFYDPSGTLTGSVSYFMPVCDPGVDSFIVFPPYYAPPAKGKHTVVYSNDKFTESIDTVYSHFEHTDYTFATDNLSVDAGGVGPADADFATAGFYIQSGGLTLTGDVPAKATYATFGISNIEAVYVPGDPTANIIGVAIYKADVDGDGVGDLSASFVDDLSAGLISYNEYEMTGNEVNDSLINIELLDINTNLPGVDLEANSAYYVSLIYDGVASGAGICVRFMNSLDVNYAFFTGYPNTPLFFGQLYTGGWSGAIVMERIQLEGYVPGVKTVEPKTLDATKVSITPNPANEYFNLEFRLDDVNPSVAVSILDAKGRMVIGSQVEKNFQNGVMTFDVKQLPSGVYFAWVRTAEGSKMMPVSVCH